MSDVFLSYSQKSQKHAEALASQLEALGISTWLDSKNLTPGVAWESAIHDAVKEARLIAFLVEPAAAPDSGKMQKESMVALEHSWADQDKMLVPILLGDAEPPPFLRHVQALKLRGRSPEWTRAAKEISQLLNRRTAPKHNKAAVKEQLERLDLIEKGANWLRDEASEAARKT